MLISRIPIGEILTKPTIQIIAEMAWSHNGSPDVAVHLVEGAKTGGADAIGLHLTSLPDYMVRHYRCTDGVTTSDRTVSEIYTYLDKINLTPEGWARVFTKAREVGIKTCVMCNDRPSLDLAERHAADMYALAAACFTEYDFIDAISRTGKPVFLRVGGASLDEIERAVSILRDGGSDGITLLHGIQLYPTGIDQLNISAIRSYRERFGVDVGLADHIAGELDEAGTLPLLAVAYGATAIEKHITVDRELKHEDFEAAIGIKEFRRFVTLIRSAECAIGSGEIGRLSEGDMRYRRVSRKRIVAAKDIAQGATISRDLVTFKRSDTGADPKFIDVIVGQKAGRDYFQDEGIDIPAGTPS